MGTFYSQYFGACDNSYYIYLIYFLYFISRIVGISRRCMDEGVVGVYQTKMRIFFSYWVCHRFRFLN